MKEVQNALNQSKVKPNIGDKKSHVYKIIAGAGKHSTGPAVLKDAVENYL